MPPAPLSRQPLFVRAEDLVKRHPAPVLIGGIGGTVLLLGLSVALATLLLMRPTPRPAPPAPVLVPAPSPAQPTAKEGTPARKNLEQVQKELMGADFAEVRKVMGPPEGTQGDENFMQWHYPQTEWDTAEGPKRLGLTFQFLQGRVTKTEAYPPAP